MFNLKDVAELLGGKLIGADVQITSVSTDTRTLQPGALFVALDGERFQGSDFIEDAHRAGAAAVLGSQADCGPLPGLVVENTTATLGQLAAQWRKRFDIPVIGVTGSNGKTMVKEMIAAILAESGEVHASPGNFNNHIGVPLTLLGLRDSHRFAVIEMGMNHPGEIDYLSRLARPTTALITNAALAHLEGLGSLAGVVRAKAEIFHGLQTGGTAVINADDRFMAYWAARVKAFQTITFGLKNRARVGGEVTADGEGQTVEIRLPDEEFEVRLNLLGRHNASNALAAASVGWACGCSADEIRTGLERVEAQPGRLQVRAGARGSTLIDDTYNANPTSLKAAIRALAARPGRKALILGDMAELGPRAEEFHAEAGREARQSGIELLLTCGDLAGLAADAFGDDARRFDSAEDLIKAARTLLSPGLTVLIKGSRSARMEQVADALVCVAQDGAIAC
ncbi:MAG TPA: UDP-N-acetylmuramoyl-tripeptide--D-alanyl-D-alanine ligase [Gammaproteobacteria bacterium]|jgi:UDP-N-acetylmuramoyl-tripeptide--D-alanyl-D-alanine ligase|nr:UDP-N-acetylmuramoyl-tripeptide--D-alanyl-D-alanine ligase [Acidiferrobacteraceae bacterium]MDP6397386.1 UDP-N-acetylmuramoyl-tripeptide--D-alanyl-D-alanine ligase [Arenicellales bacterium]HCX87794.1 UDP-N-acetylmuramoyl-tripeptide--D-alanyl-D-alanine ligase [Gammaproteobacteria bacterium]MDP6551742.1 UDP-N-acetylmuramoyl-tripeptide--D-alanyl-D-alanine ligase [Arenicellales bacterium]MDP6791468.1 UDP-N-acetylmuramoyl-tripeptide--D-alanyl-D-alanine ligase [Arenicellales bacterium]|tara:strand:+ start:5670 stop:7028 length:1359 start_codon:yes stop_codon:yes gene_type:complete